MRNLLNAKWLLAINTLPVIVMGIFLRGQYNVVKSLMSTENISLLCNNFVALGALTALLACYAGVMIVRRKPLPGVLLGCLMIAAYTTWGFVYYQYLADMFPQDLPGWMGSHIFFTYPLLFLTPTVTYGAVLVVLGSTPHGGEHKAAGDWSRAALVPVGWFCLLVILPIILMLLARMDWLKPIWCVLEPVGDTLGKFISAKMGFYMFMIVLIASVYLFFISLGRGAYIIMERRRGFLERYNLAWKIPIALIFPILGLLINNLHIVTLFTEEAVNEIHSGFFGDFSNIWFYILAVINGLLVCALEKDNRKYRTALFIGRSITFTYTLYFFMIFLPFLPLAAVFLLFFGFTFLMLTPVLLFVIHVGELQRDWQYLRRYLTGRALAGMFVAAVLVIPACLTAGYLHDRRVLHEALAYVYTPDYAQECRVNTSSIRSTLKIIGFNKALNDERATPWVAETPLLGTYFRWIVLDNLTVAEPKYKLLSRVFGAPTHKSRRAVAEENRIMTQFSSANLQEMSATSTYDAEAQVWRSKIDLTLQGERDAEYVAAFELPAGAWLSDYYLDVNGTRKPGLLSEKKAALWVYASIRNIEKKDPGIVYYQSGNKLTLRVFPFDGSKRYTGFALVHKEPFRLQLGEKSAMLGDATQGDAKSVTTPEAAYVSAAEKKTLTKVQRKPYFHFVIDASAEGVMPLEERTRRLELLTADYKGFFEQAKISFVDHAMVTHTYQEAKDSQPKHGKGGFFLDRAIRQIYYRAYTAPDESYPVIVFITGTQKGLIIEKDFADFQMAFPENDRFYLLTVDGGLQAYPLLHNSAKKLDVTVTPADFEKIVLEYPLGDGRVAYLLDNNQPDIVLKGRQHEVSIEAIREGDWNSGLALQSQWLTQVLYPDATGKAWRNLLAGSFASKLLMPVTAYMVVENAAQQAALERKQKQILAGHHALDAGEERLEPDPEPNKMSEPGLLITGLILIALIGGRTYYKRRRQAA